MSAVGSASLRYASRTLARTVRSPPPQATPAARTATAAGVSVLPGAARAAQPYRSANNGQGFIFPEGVAAVAAVAAAAAAAAGALVSSTSSRGEEGGAPVLAAGAYSIPIGRASPDVVSVILPRSAPGTCSCMRSSLGVGCGLGWRVSFLHVVCLLKDEMRARTTACASCSV